MEGAIWARRLKTHSHVLFEHIHLLSLHYPIQDSFDQELIETTLFCANRFDHFVSSFPRSDHVWKWMPRSQLLWFTRSLLTPVIGYADILLVIKPEFRDTRIPLNPPLEKPRLVAAQRVANTVNHPDLILSDYQPDDSPSRLTPGDLIDVFYPMMFAEYTRLGLSIICHSVDKMPPVLCHLETMYQLIILNLSRFFSLGQSIPMTIHVRIVAEQNGAALQFLCPERPMTPQRWNEMLRSLFLERLVSDGGSIAPLTWDEGYGQGVIVRLPWASPNTH